MSSNDSAIDPTPTDVVRPGHRLSTYMPIGDFLERIAALHRRLAEYYRALLDHSSDERGVYFAEAASWRHEQVEHILHRYRDEHQDEHALRTWLQYLPDEQVQASIDERPPKGAPLADIIDHAIDLERAFQQMYERLAGKGEIEEIRELFTSLAQIELELGKRAAWARQELIA